MNYFKKLCDNCTQQGCCTSSASPLLFQDDLEKLRNTGKSEEEYIQYIEIKGKKFKALKKKRNSNICIFWDEEKEKCSVYDKRPFECRAFPFSLELVDDKCYWTIYSCNPDSDWKWSEDYLQNLEKEIGFKQIMENIEYFNEHPDQTLGLANEFQFTFIREVNKN